MSSFNASEYISYILNKNENTSSGKELTLIENNAFAGSVAVTVVAFLPTIQAVTSRWKFLYDQSPGHNSNKSLGPFISPPTVYICFLAY